MGGGTNIGPPPIPIPSVAKAPCQGAEPIGKTTSLMIFHHFFLKLVSDCRGLAHFRVG